ncbi:hypothetical protein FKP32DRAFT_1002256 [Trametes sanguinea]|nr:hypothetical protein FKP32DRAFT_1002256 [Trametes sanguinea]
MVLEREPGQDRLLPNLSGVRVYWMRVQYKDEHRSAMCRNLGRLNRSCIDLRRHARDHRSSRRLSDVDTVDTVRGTPHPHRLKYAPKHLPDNQEPDPHAHAHPVRPSKIQKHYNTTSEQIYDVHERERERERRGCQAVIDRKQSSQGSRRTFVNPAGRDKRETCTFVHDAWRVREGVWYGIGHGPIYRQDDPRDDP